jgi:hypothetical protein
VGEQQPQQQQQLQQQQQKQRRVVGGAEESGAECEMVQKVLNLKESAEFKGKC